MEQNLQGVFKEHLGNLHERWFEQLINTYPAETVKYFARHKNTFTNPVGSNIYTCMGNILEELAGESDADKLYHELEMIMRIRAVQDMKPSRAVAFIMSFKTVLEEELSQEMKKGQITKEALMNFYEDLDSLALLGFDIYTESRELIYKLRIDQIKETNDLLQKANLLNEKVDPSTFMRCANNLEVHQQKEGE